MKKAIFMDLETSDLNFVGQILTYAFVEVDDKFKVVSSLSGKIKLSRLQIPSPEAILANKIEIMSHNTDPLAQTEPVAMNAIRNYIDNILENCDKYDEVSLIGFNISKFDIHYLRTSMIRNGVNPYFGKKVIVRDLRDLVKYITLRDDEVRSRIEATQSGFTLENLSLNVFKTQYTKQTHDAMNDVIWEIELAKHLADVFPKFGNILTFFGYQPSHLANNIQDTSVIRNSNIFFDPESKKLNRTDCNMVLLQEEGNQALWVDVDLFEQGKGKESVFWFNKTTSPFIVSRIQNDSSSIVTVSRIRDLLKTVTLENFFPPKNCDIEQFIYSMSFEENDAVAAAINYNNPNKIKKLKSQFGATVYTRYLLNNSAEINDTLKPHLEKYWRYRYGAQLKLSKNDFETKTNPDKNSTLFHEHISVTLNKIKSLMKVHSNDPVESRILESLLYYTINCNPCLNVTDSLLKEEVKPLQPKGATITAAIFEENGSIKTMPLRVPLQAVLSTS